MSFGTASAQREKVAGLKRVGGCLSLCGHPLAASAIIPAVVSVLKTGTQIAQMCEMNLHKRLRKGWKQTLLTNPND